MARIRTIKPEFWADEKLSLLDPTTRLVFLGLVSMADDAGRLVDSVKLLDGQLFPSTDDTCELSLETLARMARVIRYTSASGQALLQVANWTKHQRVDNPSKYVLPAPEPRENQATISPSDLGPTTYDLRPPTGLGVKHHGNGKLPSALVVGEIINNTRALAQRPVIGQARIPKKAVDETFDAPTARAIHAVGLSRFLKDDDYLLRDLTSALHDARSP